jgi:hypothetical protein
MKNKIQSICPWKVSIDEKNIHRNLVVNKYCSGTFNDLFINELIARTLLKQ